MVLCPRHFSTLHCLYIQRGRRKKIVNVWELQRKMCDQKILHLLKWSNQWPEGKFSPLCSTCTLLGKLCYSSGKNFTKSPRKWKSRKWEDMPNFTHRLSYKILPPSERFFSRFMNRFGQIGLLGGPNLKPVLKPRLSILRKLDGKIEGCSIIEN